ncbi:Lrp/AsnC family transcriptional regulator [bacterium]|nr:Lrp/AsnC family transcriptional regulator [bacterium]
MADALDRKILRAVQDGLPLEPEPYALVAEELGMGETELRERLRLMLERGEIRRIGASIAHRRAGIACNLMCVWRIPPDAVEAFAAEAVKHDAVTHCYDREGPPDWPYNLYAMIHGRSVDDCQRVIDAIVAATGQEDCVALRSTREFKKTWTRI